MWIPAALGLLLGSAAWAQPNNYADPKTWLCHPDQANARHDARHDACDVDLTATVIRAGGGMRREAWKADPKAPVDCFYVYPTVSTDLTPNSDMTADDAEYNVIRQQFARFAAKCLPYAPLYRQVTLAGLRQMMAGGGRLTLDRGLAYDDVRDAWNYYLEHDNRGRGVVLIGHSQGSFILAELIRREIDAKPAQARLVSAMLMGSTVAVPRDKDVGGTFQNVPVCRSASQTGCLIAYASFRATAPPPPNTLFGKVADPAMKAVCVNPASLDGGSGELHGYFSTMGRNIVSTLAPKPWVANRLVETPWVSVPGLLSGRCTSNANATYLEVSLNRGRGPRTNEITGDVSAGGQVLGQWGLHLIDVNLAIGNLVDIVEQQGKAWLRQGKK